LIMGAWRGDNYFNKKVKTMGASITLRRNRTFAGAFGKISRANKPLFTVIKRLDNKFNLIPEIKTLPAIEGLSESDLMNKIEKMSRVHFEINEGDITLG
jgi:hypothetical protein